MRQSLFVPLRHFSPVLISMGLRLSDKPKNSTGYRDLIRKTFREIDIGDNIAQFGDRGWAVLGFGKKPKGFEKRLYPQQAGPIDLPTVDKTLRFQPRMLKYKTLFRTYKYSAASAAVTRIRPRDLAVHSTGPLAARMRSGIRYGCDVTKLPVPPPSTLQPYAIPQTPKKQ